MTRKLGTSDPDTSDLGRGAMGMSGMYGHADEAESVAEALSALELHLSDDELAAIEAAVRRTRLPAIAIPRPRWASSTAKSEGWGI